MEQNKALYVGFDLGNNDSQISCFHPKTGEIETIGGRPGDNYCMIPTVLGVTETKKEWLFGEEACVMAEHEDGILVDHILERIIKEDTFVIYGTQFEGVTILEKYFRKTLLLFRKYYANDAISKIVITVEMMQPVLVETIYKALEAMGIGKDRALVQEHSQSYLYYALNQKRELWSKDVALFDYSRQGMAYYQIHINRGVQPMMVGLEKREATKQISFDLFERREYEVITERFVDFAAEAFNKQDISTIYFVGEGFLSDWSDQALQGMCVGKRGFRGPNIYTRGACYSAKNMSTGEFARRFTLVGEGILEKSLFARIYKDGKIRDVEVIMAGIPWKQAKNAVCLIFDEEEELELIVKDGMRKESSSRLITLEGMPKRANKMSRFEVDFRFEDIRTCLVTIKDRGFGEYAPSTNRVWEKRIEI